MSRVLRGLVTILATLVLAMLLAMWLSVAARAVTPSVTCGAYYTIALAQDGTLWVWGDNRDGQLGLGTVTDSEATPVHMTSATGWLAVDAGCTGSHTLAIQSPGTLWSWGANEVGQLGLGDTTERHVPTRVDPSLSGFSSIAAGASFSAAVTAGIPRTCGYNYDGELGQGTTVQDSLCWTPRYVKYGASDTYDWSAVAAGRYYMLGLLQNGTLYAWGYNFSGQLGVGDYTTPRSSPTQVIGSGYAQVAAGESHTVAVRTDGSLWAWGWNGYGQCGLGNAVTYTNSPMRVGTANDWAAVACGQDHTLALRTDGSLWAWGRNQYGELGQGDTTQLYTPTRIGSLTGWTAVACGYQHSAAVRNDGSVWTWGYNWKSALGLGDSADRWVPTQVNMIPAPTITSFLPTSGPVGTVVTLTGSDFTDASAVAFHGTPAVDFNVVNATHMTATVPTAATTGTISVTTPGGTGTSTQSFTVTAVVTPTLTLKLSGLSSGAVKLGKSVTAKGTVTPTSLAGSQVKLTVQQKKAGKWVKVKSASCTIGVTRRLQLEVQGRQEGRLPHAGHHRRDGRHTRPPPRSGSPSR